MVTQKMLSICAVKLEFLEYISHSRLLSLQTNASSSLNYRFSPVRIISELPSNISAMVFDTEHCNSSKKPTKTGVKKVRSRDPGAVIAAIYMSVFVTYQPLGNICTELKLSTFVHLLIS